MPFYWPSCTLTFCLLLFYLSLISFYGLVLWGWGLRTDRMYIGPSQDHYQHFLNNINNNNNTLTTVYIYCIYIYIYITIITITILITLKQCCYKNNHTYKNKPRDNNDPNYSNKGTIANFSVQCNVQTLEGGHVETADAHMSEKNVIKFPNIFQI